MLLRGRPVPTLSPALSGEGQGWVAARISSPYLSIQRVVLPPAHGDHLICMITKRLIFIFLRLPLWIFHRDAGLLPSGLEYFDFSPADGSHAFEVNAAYESDRVYLSANYIINEAGGVGSSGSDLYFEGGVSFEYFTVFIGAGSGWHTVNGSFNVCNLGLAVPGEIEITDRFSIPVAANLIFNPDSEKLYIVATFSF